MSYVPVSPRNILRAAVCGAALMVPTLSFACTGQPTKGNPVGGAGSSCMGPAMPYRYTREHISYRLGRSGRHQDTYLEQFDFTDSDHNWVENGPRWSRLGVEGAEYTGAMVGETIKVDGLMGMDMQVNERGMWGYTVGMEYQETEIVTDGTSQSIGASAGVYGGRAIGERGLVEGHVTGTHLWHELEDLTGATAETTGLRLTAHASVSATFGDVDTDWTFTPYLEADYSVETIDGYTLAGVAVADAEKTSGLASLGTEIHTPFNADRGQAFLRLQLDKTFETSDITLASGTVVAPYEDVTGRVGLGWISNTSFDSIARIELTYAGIGNDDAQDARLDGHWERNF